MVFVLHSSQFIARYLPGRVLLRRWRWLYQAPIYVVTVLMFCNILTYIDGGSLDKMGQIKHSLRILECPTS